MVRLIHNSARNWNRSPRIYRQGKELLWQRAELGLIVPKNNYLKKWMQKNSGIWLHIWDPEIPEFEVPLCHQKEGWAVWALKVNLCLQLSHIAGSVLCTSWPARLLGPCRVSSFGMVCEHKLLAGMSSMGKPWLCERQGNRKTLTDQGNVNTTWCIKVRSM